MPQIAAGGRRRRAIGDSSRRGSALPHTLIVNRAGPAVLNESLNYYDAGEAFGTKEGGSPRNLPAWCSSTARARRSTRSLARRSPAATRAGVVGRGESLEELAGRARGRPGGAAGDGRPLQRVRPAGVDEDFGRGGTRGTVRGATRQRAEPVARDRRGAAVLRARAARRRARDEGGLR